MVWVSGVQIMKEERRERKSNQGKKKEPARRTIEAHSSRQADSVVWVSGVQMMKEERREREK